MDNGMSQISCLLAKIGHITSPVTCPNSDRMFSAFIKIRFFALLENRSTSEKVLVIYELAVILKGAQQIKTFVEL